MALSIFQIFKLGIGPSSSHTVGPMKAASTFLLDCQKRGLINNAANQAGGVKVDLFGSLALTGKGHATDSAILLGLEGLQPETVTTAECQATLEHIRHTKMLNLLKVQQVPYKETTDMIFNKTKKLKYHSNGMRLALLNAHRDELFSDIYYSVGGGFILNEEQTKNTTTLAQDDVKVPFPFKTADELLGHCRKHNLTIAEVMMENEKAWRSESEVNAKIQEIYTTMKDCVYEGCIAKGILPGALKLERRANRLYTSLMSNQPQSSNYSYFMNWVNMWAMAANEQNASGGKVVTAPTNGACGVIPAVMHYYEKFLSEKHPNKINDYFLTAGAIGIIFKLGASISGAEGGCQSEVGTACAMAAGGLAATMGANLQQVESAAEIGMEHNLGLTCDPVGGLVQIPCIERNTMGAIKAINATTLSMSLNAGGKYRVSLDRIVKVAKKTGDDMKKGYKETSLAGLAAEFKKDVQKEERLMKSELRKATGEKIKATRASASEPTLTSVEKNLKESLKRTMSLVPTTFARLVQCNKFEGQCIYKNNTFKIFVADKSLKNMYNRR